MKRASTVNTIMSNCEPCLMSNVDLLIKSSLNGLAYNFFGSSYLYLLNDSPFNLPSLVVLLWTMGLLHTYTTTTKPCLTKWGRLHGSNYTI